MSPRPLLGPAGTIWLVCTGIGLLFLARGAFQPYIFPLFESVAGLSYGQISLLLNAYVLAQSLGAPVAGWFTDRTSVRVALLVCIGLGLTAFLLVATHPGAALSAFAVLMAGLAFVLGKIALNTVLVTRCSPDLLRRSVAKRATLLNVGSFVGNSIAYQMTTRVGYGAHALLLGLLHLPLAIGLAAQPAPLAKHEKVFGLAPLRALASNRAFLADCLRRFSVVLPYGCWGTIIPKYVIDRYGSNQPVWIVYLTSLCTTIVGAHLLASYISDRLYRRGFRWESWSAVSVGFYCVGLLLLMGAHHRALLPIGVIVFICGEVVMTPCFDETAKRHSGTAGMGTCMGLLHLVDGLGRMLGAAFALAVYGVLRGTPAEHRLWPIVVVSFALTALLLQGLARAIARDAPPTEGAVLPR